MKIDVHVVCRNEAVIMPYFLRHYSTFADRIFVIDDQSDDGTRRIVAQFPKAILLDYECTTGLDDYDIDDTYKQNILKYSRGVADWVMCPNADEFVYHKDGIVQGLERCEKKGNRALICCGYTMISKSLPMGKGQIYDEIREGVRDKWYNKAVVFDPALDAVYGRGRHNMVFPENARGGYGGFMLLHYRFLSVRYVIERNLMNLERKRIATAKSNGLIRPRVAWTYEKALPIFLRKTMETYVDGLERKEVVL